MDGRTKRTENQRTAEEKIQEARARLITLGEDLEKALARPETCNRVCFRDARLLAQCADCRDALAMAAARYAKGTRKFRELALPQITVPVLPCSV